jgi:hypothetical protein
LVTNKYLAQALKKRIIPIASSSSSFLRVWFDKFWLKSFRVSIWKIKSTSKRVFIRSFLIFFYHEPPKTEPFKRRK